MHKLGEQRKSSTVFKLKVFPLLVFFINLYLNIMKTTTIKANIIRTQVYSAEAAKKKR